MNVSPGVLLVDAPDRRVPSVSSFFFICLSEPHAAKTLAYTGRNWFTEKAIWYNGGVSEKLFFNI